MAIGFITRHSSALLIALSPLVALAQDVGVVGVFPGKGAVLVIDGHEPKSVRIGESTKAGVRLIEVTRSGAVLEIDGKRRSISLGQHYRGQPRQANSNPSVVLAADSRGHFTTPGTVNGSVQIQFLVDTGATMVTLSIPDATRLNIDYRNNQRGVSMTANGPAPVYRIKLDTLKIGELELHNVDALVLDGAGPGIALLGMSFLNRVEMKRDGQTMTLVKRF